MENACVHFIVARVRWPSSRCTASSISCTACSVTRFGVGKLVGTIEVGKEADLVAVRGDPLADIHCLNDIVTIVRAGELVRGQPGTAASNAS